MAQYVNGDTWVRLLPVAGTFAVGTLTFAGNAANDETVTIGTHVYTWKDTLTGAANEILVGADAAASIVNLVAAINGAAGAGTTYGTGTVANVFVSAVDGAGDTIDVTARQAYEGPAGSVATTDTMGSGSWGATVLTGAGATTSAVPSLTSTSIGVELPYMTDQATVLLRSVRGSGTMTADIRLWGWSKATLRWYNLGQINSGTPVGELSTDAIAHAEPIVGLRRFTKLYAEIEALGGTATEVELVVDCVPCANVSC